MRSAPTQDTNIALADGQAVWLRIFVADGSGADQEVTNLYGEDFLDSLDLSESIDQPIQTATLTLRREVFKLSVAPLVASSRVNVNAGTGNQLFALGRRLTIDAQIRPSGAPVDSSQWHRIFLGYIDAVDPGSADYGMKVEARDQGAKIQRRFIEEERVYGVWFPGRTYLANTVVTPTGEDPNDSTNTRYMKVTTPGTTSGSTWQPSHTYAAGSYVLPTLPDQNEFYSSGGGTSGSTEPVWPLDQTSVADGSVTWFQSSSEPSPWPNKGSTGTVTDGTVTFTEGSTQGTPLETAIQQLLDDNLGVSVVTLNVPSSPGYFVRDWNQSKTNVLDACKALADLIGWDLRYVWDGNESTGSFKFTLQQPARTSPSVAYTIGPSKYRSISQFSQDLTAIRNKIQVVYYDRGTLDASGNPTKRRVVVSDSTSITAYDVQFMEVAEAGTSQIDTAAEATALANAILSDLKDPILNVQLTTEFIWWLQLNDYVTITADMLHSDSDQSVALYSIKHSFKQGGAATSQFGLRGKPCSGHYRWHEMEARPGVAKQNRLVGPRAPRQISTSAAVGGLVVLHQPPVDPRYEYETTELYLSTSNGFAANSSTRIATSKNGRFDVHGLTPATTYYMRLRHLDVKGNPGPLSAQFSQAAGQALLIHLNPSMRQNFLAHLGTDTTWGGSTTSPIPFDTTDYDTSPSSWNASTFTWTVQQAGKYQVRVQVQVANVAAGDAVQLLLERTNHTPAVVAASNSFQVVQTDLGAFEAAANMLAVINASVGDTFQVLMLLGPNTNPVVATILSQDLNILSDLYHQGSYIEVTQALQ